MLIRNRAKTNTKTMNNYKKNNIMNNDRCYHRNNNENDQISLVIVIDVSIIHNIGRGSDGHYINENDYKKAK